MKSTNLKEVRKIASDFLFLTPTPNECLPFFVEHPFFDSCVLMNYKKELIHVFDDSGELSPEFVDLRNEYAKRITSSSLSQLFAMILTKYHLAFLKYVKPYLCDEDFAKYLAYAWVRSENPNQDANVSISTLIKWFKKADKQYLMEQEELSYYSLLPEEVKVYRGVACGRAESKGLSWTGNYKTAEWFANRFNHDDEKGYIIEGKIKKSDIFAYFNGRDEDELLCDSSKIYEKKILR